MAPPFGGKKKPAVTVAIGVGKPKGPGPDLGAPDPLEGKPDAAEEAAESPDEEKSEEGGGDLLGAMTKPLVDAGLSDEDAKSMLSSIFDALCAKLKGGSEHEEPPMDGGMPGGSPYGR